MSLSDGAVAVMTKHLAEPQPRPIDWHTHRWHELLWGFTGVRTVETEHQVWAVPPTAGLWMPAGTPHAGFAGAESRHFFTFVDPEVFPSPWTQPTLVGMPPAVRELLLHLRDSTLTAAERLAPERAAISLLRPMTGTEILLPIPSDPRARAVALAVANHPSDHRTTERWGREVGVSGRTLDRLFLAQTELTFTRWRLQARVRAAVLLIAEGQSSTSVAHQVGYQTASAFVRAFRQTTGTTPRAYVAALRGRGAR